MIDSRPANEGNGWAGSGGNPWHLDDETESIQFLTNMGDRDVRIGYIVSAGGVNYYVTDLKLKPHETRAIDIRKLRDAQKEDIKGNKIPAGATDGSVIWNRIEHVPVMGQLVALKRNKGTASPYSCTICNCGLSFSYLYVTPSSMNLAPVLFAPAMSTGVYVHPCSGLLYYYDITTSASWWSTSPSIATVNNSTYKGRVTGVSAGTTQYWANFTDDVVDVDCSYPNCCYLPPLTDGGGGTANICGLSIDTPTSNQVLHLGGANYNTATLPLKAASACSGTANWTLDFTYTRGSGTSYTSSATTSTTINSTSNYPTPVGKGGRVNLQAQATLSGQSFSDSKIAYVDGVAIPNATITSRLTSLYSGGATSNLLAHIAAHESGCYCQFTQRSMLGVTGRWPTESYDGGSHVGLMQVPNGMANAFDWYTNTQAGKDIFQQKLSYVNGWVTGQRDGHPNLPDLTPTQKEDDALVFYGPYAVELQHYYIPNPSYTGWITNPQCSNGQGYVNLVRTSVIPG